jgi:transcriptional regulator with XRE-family HTH domain
MIGDTLKKLRTIYGHNANEMRQLLGISNSYLSEIENNKKKPSLELLEKYSGILGLKVSSMILLSEQESSGNQEFVKKLMSKWINTMSKDLVN